MSAAGYNIGWQKKISFQPTELTWLKYAFWTLKLCANVYQIRQVIGSIMSIILQ